MKSLKFFPQQESDHLIQPEEFYNLQPDSPARNVLSDFRQHKPHMIDSHLKASDALSMMLAEDVSMKIVVDIEKEFIGVLDRSHLSSENMLLKQLSLGLKHSELLVKDLMYSRANILAVDIGQLDQVKVGDLVSSMKASHQEYLLVVDKDAHHIRGIISSREIGRRLRQPVAIEKERTFAGIFSAVHVS
jgi:CBS domain containing-hemolysin-like protein